MSVSLLFRSLARFFSAGTRAAEGERPPCNARRRSIPLRLPLEVEPLEDRLCPSTIVLNITDPSQVPFQLPGIFHRGEHIAFAISAGTTDDTEDTENESEYLSITSSSGRLNEQINVGQTVTFVYTVTQPFETISVNSSDGDEVGLIIASPLGKGEGASHPVYSVSSDFWNWQKLAMMDQLQKHIQGGANDPFPNLPPGYDHLAGGWDNAYFHNFHNSDWFTFQDGSFNGRTLMGHEVNYYFQGMAAAAYGRSLGQLKTRVFSYYLIAHHRQPPGNVWLAAIQGYEHYQADLQYWQQQTQGGTQSLPPQPPPPTVVSLL
jgi:hypothetical protein